MPEIKNNFLGAKMNKDVDDRLLPPNEYRHAVNISINRSDGSDVGTLQNVLGNKRIVDFNDPGTTGLECIGVCADPSTNNIYIFLTNYTNPPGIPVYNKDAKNYIYVYDSLNNTSTPAKKLVEGAFLNFSTTNPIIGVNVLEDLLFWTDNRNQPRRINITKANPTPVANPTYYTLEEQIAVAKINPLYPAELYRASEDIVLSASATVGTVSSTAPYTATITPTVAFPSIKLNVGAAVYATSGTSTFTSGIVTTIVTSGANITSFNVSSATIFISGDISSLYTTPYETTMLDVVSEDLPDGITPNPYYIDAGYTGDPAYLEDKYVRFSYRYRFEDGEYSIMAPFTQIAYIPQQDGYFMYKAPDVVGGEPITDDEVSAYRSTIVDFMKNKVNNIFLQIKLPCASSLLNSTYKISYIEILYKDANELAVKVVDIIPVDSTFGNEEAIYSYNYQSKKPYKTLPAKDLVRVYDKTPIKALGQEIISNRVVYSNYQDKASYPKYLNYNVGCGPKYNFGTNDGEGTSIIEYPNHSVKQNRNYQVGVILCDKFGRESGVILSNKTTTSNSSFGSSSLYAPYSSSGDIVSNPISGWPGDSLKVLFNEEIGPTQPNNASGWPGIYNGDWANAGYNPLGWYSYKIVVKQTEQEYYNVYVPGTMAAYPADSLANPTELGKTSHIVLLNDNINKVPRDLTEVGPAQLQFRSSVALYPRVNNNATIYDNEMYFPGTTYSVVSTIATNESLFWSTAGAPDPLPLGFNNFYQLDSNPLVARISTSVKPLDILGIQAATVGFSVINLAVYETKPVESKLDIYWETSSTGIISELNTAIEEGADFSIKALVDWEFILSEAGGNGSFASDYFSFVDKANIPIIPTSVTLLSATTQNGTPVEDSFEIVKKVDDDSKYILKTKINKYFYYGLNAALQNSYIFTIKATVGSPEVSKTVNVTGNLININPTIAAHEPTITKQTGALTVYDFNGSNGSNPAGGNSTSGLIWSVTGSSEFTIDVNGVLKTSNPVLTGTFNLVIKMEEASGLSTTTSVTVIYPVINRIEFSNGNIIEYEGSSVGMLEGTVTAYGSPYYLWAYARMTVGVSASNVSTDVIVGSEGRNATDYTVAGGGAYSGTYIELLPGIATPYNLLVQFEGSEGYGEIYYSTSPLDPT